MLPPAGDPMGTRLGRRMMVDAGYYRDLLATAVRGRKVILAGPHVAAASPRVGTLRELGSDRCFILAPAMGTGALPNDADAEWVSLDIVASNSTEMVRRFEKEVASLPGHVLQALDRFDPDGSALTYVDTVQATTSIGRRPAYGPRRPVWVALEDKAVIDQFFDDVGVPRPPSAVVSVQHDDLLAAAAQLGRDQGTVWSGDSRDGYNGGGVLVRWVRTEEDAGEAVRFFGEQCSRVRIAPFVEGIPCSIHGLVLDSGVAVFRPVELITLRASDGGRLRYAGCATFWDPTDDVRAAIRAIARRLGTALRQRVGYRGAFALDGIVSDESFVANELNPRFGAGLNVIDGCVPELPLLLLHHAVIAGEPWDLRSDDLEELIVTAADERRGGGGWLTVAQPRAATEEHRLVEGNDGYRLAEETESAHARLLIGSSSVGGFVRFEPDPVLTPVGASIAPRVAAGFEAADRYAGTTIGQLIAAQEV